MPRKSTSRAHDSSTSMNPWGAFESPSIRGADQKRPKPTQPLPSSILGVRWKSKTVRGPRSSESMKPCARGARSLALLETLCRLSVHEHLGSGAQVSEAHESVSHFRGQQPSGSHEALASTSLGRLWGVFGSKRSGVQPASVCGPRCVGFGHSQVRIQI